MTRILVPLPYDVSDQAHGRNLRIVNLLRALCPTQTVTCLSSDEAEARRAGKVLPRAAHVAADTLVHDAQSDDELAVTGALQQRAIRFFSRHRAIEQAAARLARDHEIALGFDLPALAPLLGARKANPSMKIALDVIDDPWLTWSSQSRTQRFCLSGLKCAAALHVIRRKMLKQCDLLMAVAPRDAETLSKASGRRVDVIPNGIHVPASKVPARREPLIVFTGAMSFPPNEAAAIFFLKKVWPLIQRQWHSECKENRPRCAIVGAGPSPRLRHTADAAGAEVTGYVDDLSAWLRRARVAVAPMVSGSGMKNKILEACAAGCPVVTTPLGAAGLPTGEAYGVLCAETAEQFAATVVELIRIPAKSEAMGGAAARMVTSRYTWQASADRLRALLKARSHKHQRLRPSRASIKQDAPAPNVPADTKETMIHAVS